MASPLARSGPSHTYPKRAYRNPLDQVVAYLDDKHKDNWAIWEFRGEGTGYPDDLVYDRIRHYPWPDHHPPPFRLVPLIMASMRNWLHGGSVDGSTPATSDTRDPKRVAVVHCKAGKGRSGSMACSYLISHEGWDAGDAMKRFTEKRMRPMFGDGVSIPSQVRWVGYVDRWTKGGKVYKDRPVEILEIHTWGLRDGVKVEIEGFAEQGKRIEVLHTFKRDERVVVEGDAPPSGLSDIVLDMAGYGDHQQTTDSSKSDENPPRLIKHTDTGASTASASSTMSKKDQPGGKAVIFRPSVPVRVANSDVNVSLERRNKTHKSLGLTMVSAVAHVWFNAFFEGGGPESGGVPKDSGVFSIDWEAMDGIKGLARKGARAMDRMSVVWRFADADDAEDVVVQQGREIPQLTAADWHGVPDGGESSPDKDLGLRAQNDGSKDVSRANSVQSKNGEDSTQPDDDVMKSVKSDAEP